MHVVTLALDLGTHTGFALLRQDGLIESGTEVFAPQQGEGAGGRFIRFRRFLIEVKEKNPALSRVVFERVHHVGAKQAYASQLYGGFLAVLLMFIEHHHMDSDELQVAKIKKRWTGRGDAKKDEMVARCRALGFKPSSDNEADAIAILHVALDREPPLPAQVIKPRPKAKRDISTAALDLMPRPPQPSDPPPF
jgi:hypothetical protein